MMALATRYGRYGYRRITALLRGEGWLVNHKRVERPTTSPFAVSAMQLEASPSHVPQTELNTVIRQYCIRCHNQRLT